MSWTELFTLISALGGIELIRWIANRKNWKRSEEVKVKEAENDAYEKQIERYEMRLMQRDNKIDAIYKELRENEKREISYIQEINRLKFEVELRELQKCEVRGCAQRKPPGNY